MGGGKWGEGHGPALLGIRSLKRHSLIKTFSRLIRCCKPSAFRIEVKNLKKSLKFPI